MDKDKSNFSFENSKMEPKSENFDEKKHELNIRINKEIIDKNEVVVIGNKNNNNIKDFIEHINLNIFYYLCCIKNSRIYKNIELYNLGKSYFRQKMDIVRVFTLLAIIEDLVKKKK